MYVVAVCVLNAAVLVGNMHGLLCVSGLCSYQMCVGVVFWLQYIMCMLQLCHLLGLAHTSAPQPEQSGVIV